VDVTANPWLAASWNLTDQGAFVKKFGIAVAQRRMKEAGVKLGDLRPPGPKPDVKVYVIKGRKGDKGDDGGTVVVPLVIEGD
jgi:hypothetical protein